MIAQSVYVYVFTFKKYIYIAAFLDGKEAVQIILWVADMRNNINSVF